MLWDKKVYSITISGGVGSFNTDPMRGRIEQLLIIPTTTTNTYNVNFTDKDGDIIYQNLNAFGRIDDRAGLPIGKDLSEKWTVSFSSVGINEAIKVIFKVRETVQ